MIVGQAVQWFDGANAHAGQLVKIIQEEDKMWSRSQGPILAQVGRADLAVWDGAAYALKVGVLYDSTRATPNSFAEI